LEFGANVHGAPQRGCVVSSVKLSRGDAGLCFGASSLEAGSSLFRYPPTRALFLFDGFCFCRRCAEMKNCV
jgi:hypothetical protein